MKARVAFLLGAPAGFAAYALAARLLSGPSPSGAGRAPECPACPPDPGPVDCAAQAAALVSLFERARAGAPLPFPDDLPPAYTPEGFRANVEQALRDCPDLAAMNPEVECSEYPCLLVGASTLSVSVLCPSLAAAYTGPQESEKTYPFRTADGDQDQVISVSAFWPVDRPGGELEKSRMHERVERIRLDRMEALGGREITAEEHRRERLAQLEESLPEWRDKAAAGDLDAEEMVQQLERKRAALLRR